MSDQARPYLEKFPAGTLVRVRDRDFLEQFKKEWRFHHPLEDRQMSFAGRTARVAHVGFYHGGDVVYGLDGLPGTWHEVCLEGTSDFNAG